MGATGPVAKKVGAAGLAQTNVCDKVHTRTTKSLAPERRRQAAIGDGMARRDSNMESRHHNLKTRQRRERHGYPDNLSLRVHRALSWRYRAEQETDADSRFIFLWIAFNAAYATEIDDREGLSEQSTFNAFLENLQSLDSNHRLNKLVWDAYPDAIRVLLDNSYVFSCLWDHHKGQKSEDQWKQSFESAKKAANHALAQQDTPRLLAIVLSRIYTLRNQIVHGGATWNSSVNRDQVRDCVNFMGELVPAVIEIMMDGPNTLWGKRVIRWYGMTYAVRKLAVGSIPGMQYPFGFLPDLVSFQFNLHRFEGRV